MDGSDGAGAFLTAPIFTKKQIQKKNYLENVLSRKTQTSALMGTLILKAKTRQEVAEEFGICVKTLNRRLKKQNIVVSPGVFFPKTLKIIYETFGVPEFLRKS